MLQGFNNQLKEDHFSSKAARGVIQNTFSHKPNLKSTAPGKTISPLPLFTILV